MSLSRVVMRLARNPGTEFADGDDHRGYMLCVPLTPDGKLDEAAFKKNRAALFKTNTNASSRRRDNHCPAITHNAFRSSNEHQQNP